MEFQTVDLRGTLGRNPAGGPNRRVPLSRKRGLIVHYYGPPPSTDDRRAIQIAADWHLSKDWDEDNRNGQHLSGDGLMYHIVIGRDGTRYRCRDLDEVLWHCGNWPENELALSVLVLVGGDDRATFEQIVSLRVLCDQWMAESGTTRDEIKGHQEVGWTDCPGTLMFDFVLPYRSDGLERVQAVDDGRWFSETGCYVGGGFYQFWLHNGGVLVFGYPLTNERDEADAGAGDLLRFGVPLGHRRVQYFERCVMEWHPENKAPYQILLRHLGREALARQAG